MGPCYLNLPLQRNAQENRKRTPKNLLPVSFRASMTSLFIGDGEFFGFLQRIEQAVGEEELGARNKLQGRGKTERRNEAWRKLV
jgi:hypothetical protein